MRKRLNSNQMCKQFSYKEVFLIKRFLIERFYCIYTYVYKYDHNWKIKQNNFINKLYENIFYSVILSCSNITLNITLNLCSNIT